MLQKELKEIVFLCLGDSTDASTWSNVPYLFAQALEKKSILVRRVDITPPSVLFKFLKIAYKIFITTPLKFIYKDSVHNFYRSKIFLKLANKHIDKQLAKYPNADLCIFLNFDFYNKITNAPTLLFGDWTLEILVKDRHKREMYPIEKKFADYEMDVINHAQYVIPMFPETAKFLTQKNVKPKVCYLGMNMVNNLYKGGVDESIIKNKKAKKQILFIGRKNYLKSAIKTIEAVNLLGNEVELHIVGLQADDVNIPSKNTIFHGFLHKDNQEENQEYYNLLINSSLVVNANPEWEVFLQSSSLCISTIL